MSQYLFNANSDAELTQPHQFFQLDLQESFYRGAKYTIYISSVSEQVFIVCNVLI